MEKELLIEVKNMTKFFGPTQALKGVDMRFYRGEIRGLIGKRKRKVNGYFNYCRNAGCQRRNHDIQRAKLET